MISIEAHLLAKLADELADTALPSPAPTSDRWILASQLQKAIRRGHVCFALAAALRLLEVDGAYLWRRLRVITAEDIGLANEELVGMVFAIAGKRALHRRLGDVRLLTHVVVRMCESTKNRTACELSCWIDFSTRTTALREALAADGPAAWQRAACSRTADDLTRAIAWQLACGFTERVGATFRPWSTLRADVVEVLLAAAQANDILSYLVMRSRDSEGLAAMLPIAQEFCRDQHIEMERTPRSDPACEVIDGLMAAAFCRHTRVGLAAFRLFLRRHPAFVRTLTAAGAASPTRALGLLVFQCESGITDRTLDPSAARQLRQHVEGVIMASVGVTDLSAAQSLRDELRALLPKLNEARAEVAWVCDQADLLSSRS